MLQMQQASMAMSPFAHEENRWVEEGEAKLRSLGTLSDVTSKPSSLYHIQEGISNLFPTQYKAYRLTGSNQYI